MKKHITMLGLVALTGIAMTMAGCCGGGSCPFSKKAKSCKCGAPKGSEACASACKKSADLCKCGAPKGSAACAAACKK